MKSSNLKIILSLGLLTVIILFISKNNSELNFVENQEGLINEYPHEWMYNQRAYPNNFINTEAIENAITISKQIKSNRSIQGSDCH